MHDAHSLNAHQQEGCLAEQVGKFVSVLACNAVSFSEAQADVPAGKVQQGVQG